jgi:alanine racemase
MLQAEVCVDLAAIRENVSLVRSMTSAEVMTAVKADGYGHGMVQAARAALAGGASRLGVATLDEALRLRAAGITAPILSWLYAPTAPLHEGVARDVDLSVGSVAGLAAVVAAAAEAGRPATVHLKADTGMSRGGAPAAQWPELVEEAAKAQASGAVDVLAVWSHLAAADQPGHPSVDHQLAAFHEAIAAATRGGLNPSLRHLANSPATLTRPDTHFDLVRPGLASYGLSPFPAHSSRSFGLRPAMRVRAAVVLVKRVPAGSGVSYGLTYTTKNETTLALLPIGYGDGVPWAAGNRGEIWLAGKRRPIAGRVCMDQLMVDCGDDPVEVGDEAVLFGDGEHGEPTADDWAAACGTVNYEIVTRMGSDRTPRVYVNGEAEWPT